MTSSEDNDDGDHDDDNDTDELYDVTLHDTLTNILSTIVAARNNLLRQKSIAHSIPYASAKQ